MTEKQETQENDSNFIHSINFQKQLLKTLAHDVKFTIEYANDIKQDYFSTPSFRFLFCIITDYVFEYETELDESNCLVLIDDFCTKNSYPLEMLKMLKEDNTAIFNTKVASYDFVKDKTEKFIQRRALKEALKESLEIFAGGGDAEDVLGVIDNAISSITSDNADMGSTFEDVLQIKKLREKYYDPSKLVKTGIDPYDYCLGGGMAAGEVHCVMAPPKTGKTSFAVNLGASLLAMNKSVFHITLEISEVDVLSKYASRLSQIDLNELANMDMALFQQKMNTFMKINSVPKLFIKKWVMNTVTTMHIRSWITKIRTKTKISPDIIIIDYDDYLNPTKSKDKEYDALGQVYTDMFALGGYFNCPVFTLAQPNREVWYIAEQGGKITSGNLAHSGKKAMLCSSLSTLNFKKGSSDGLLYVDLNRRGIAGKEIKLKRELGISKFATIDDGGKIR